MAGKPVAITGWYNKIGAAVCKILPSAVTVKVARKINQHAKS
jgi:hypothetical protein